MARQTDRLVDRSEDKWAHPELIMLYQRFGTKPPVDPADTILNADLPYDQRKEMMVATDEAIRAFAGDPDTSRRITYYAKGCEEEPDAPELEIAVVTPQCDAPKNDHCVYYIPGGGLYSCLLDFQPMEALADACNCTTVSIRYRTIYSGGGVPQTMNDCHAGFKWVLENAEMLGIDPDKIVLFGQSSGSQLALSLCHRLKRYGYYGHEPRGCVVMDAITDERLIYPSSKLTNYIWAGSSLHHSSKLWLGSHTTPVDVTAEDFPNHADADDCIGLPPTFIHIDEHDCSVDPAAAYASKLIQAGVYTDFHIWGGGNHGLLTYDLPYIESDYLRRFEREIFGNINDCFEYDLRRPWLLEE